MNVVIVSGKGEGKTKISAFDNALLNCGLMNYNIIRLSSILPPQTRIKEQGKYKPPEKIGNKLYAVYAKKTQTVPGKMSVAGIGWANNPEKGGILVEVEGIDRSQVETNIINSLNHMKKYRDADLGENNFKIIKTKCNNNPVSVFVGAVFKEKTW